VKPVPFEYHCPATLDDALTLLADDPDAKPLAGGQSLVPILNFRLGRPSALVDLNGRWLQVNHSICEDQSCSPRSLCSWSMLWSWSCCRAV